MEAQPGLECGVREPCTDHGEQHRVRTRTVPIVVDRARRRRVRVMVGVVVILTHGGRPAARFEMYSGGAAKAPKRK